MRTRINVTGDWDQGQPSLSKKTLSQLSGKYVCDGIWIWALFSQGNRSNWLWSRSILKTQREAISWVWQGTGEEQNSQLGCWWPESQAAEMQGWVPSLVWEESGSPFWETENSLVGSWTASQSPWCPKLLPYHCQTSMSENYVCSLPRCSENRWSWLCCF